MATEWFYKKDDEKTGPVSIDELQGLLRGGKLSLWTLVWNQELSDWTPAGRLEELTLIRRPHKTPPIRSPEPESKSRPTTYHWNSHNDTLIAERKRKEAEQHLQEEQWREAHPVLSTIKGFFVGESPESQQGATVAMKTDASQARATAPRHNDASELLFWGDGCCPSCNSLLWIEWKSSYNSAHWMKCGECGSYFDLHGSLKMLEAHRPGQGGTSIEEIQKKLARREEEIARKQDSEMRQSKRPAPDDEKTGLLGVLGDVARSVGFVTQTRVPCRYCRELVITGAMICPYCHGPNPHGWR